MILSRYGQWLGGQGAFGKAALKAAKLKPLLKPYREYSQEPLRKQVVGMVRGGGLEPPSANNAECPEEFDVIDISKLKSIDE